MSSHNRGQKRGHCNGNCEQTGTRCDECHGKGAPVAYVEECPPKCCHVYCEGMSPHKLWCEYQSAVVHVLAEFHFTTSTTPTNNPPVQLAYGTNLETVYKESNGFFIDQHIIVVPASTVLAAPDHTLGYNRWPFAANRIVPTNFQSDVMTRANRITVDVHDVNGSKHSYNYQADIIGVYGFGDFAILYIDDEIAYNKENPCIKKCHPHFKFACSTRYRPGNRVMAIGNVGTRSFDTTSSINSNTPQRHNQVNGIVTGHIVDARHLDHLGLANQELLFVGGMQIFNGASGLPLINEYGHVIGMQTMNIAGAVAAGDATHNVTANAGRYHGPNGDGYVAGPTQTFMMEIIKRIVCSLRSRYADFIETISDPVGDYIRYVHGFIGGAFEVVSGKDYMCYRSATDGSTLTRFDAANPGQYLTSPEIKEIVGLRVAGLTNDIVATRVRGDVYLPGAAAPGSVVASPWVNSALSLALNDIIVYAESNQLGDESFGGNDLEVGHLSFLLFTSRMKVGDSFKIKARTFASNYDSEVVMTVGLLAAPRFYDYPHYKYHSFYPSSLSLYGTFFDRPLPQDPGVAGSHPGDASLEVPTIPVI